MNRRSFFGFAVGGIAAAPVALLVGEKANDYAAGISDLEPIAGEPPVWGVQTVTVQMNDEDYRRFLHNQVRGEVEKAIKQALHEQRRNGFGAMQSRYAATKG